MNPNPDPDFTAYCTFSADELRTLELRWYEGRMLLYVEWLEAFVGRHRAEILALANGSAVPDDLLAAAKRLIFDRGSVHMAGELRDQAKEIENELWYRGEKGDYNRPVIEANWAYNHGPDWRRWRVREYLFVADRCAGRVVRLLQPPSSAPHEPAPLDAEQLENTPASNSSIVR